MKTYLSLLSIAALVAACDSDNNGPRVFGSGNVVSEERILGAFDHIEVEGSINIILRQEATQAVSVEADDNIVPIITTQVRNGELVISSSQNYHSRNPITVYIAIPAVRALRVKGSADLVGDTALEGEVLDIEVAGSGTMELEVYYDQLTASITGSSDMTLSGEVIRQDVSVTGSGNYQAHGLPSEECKISITGSGNGVVRASKLLDATVSGSGDVVYYGEPEVRISVTGSGDVEQG